MLGTAIQIGPYIRKGQLVVLESTTYPGTTRDRFLPAIQSVAGALRSGNDFLVAYSPEREDPARVTHGTAEIPKVVGGTDEASRAAAEALYRRAFDVIVPVDSAEIAESAKLLENVYRAVNIALVNELKMVLDGLQIDVSKVIEAASTKPFGFVPFRPGPGLGGHCIPIDPFYLAWLGRESGRPAYLVETAGDVNRRVTEFVIEKIEHALSTDSRSVEGAQVLVLGIAYKPDVDDTRESPAFEIMTCLMERGADVQYSDPHVRRTPAERDYGLKLSSVNLTPGILAEFDVVVLVADHDAFDYEMIGRYARRVVDTRDAFRSRGVEVHGSLFHA